MRTLRKLRHLTQLTWGNGYPPDTWGNRAMVQGRLDFFTFRYTSMRTKGLLPQ